MGVEELAVEGGEAFAVLSDEVAAHHVVEAQFKAVARALRQAVAIDPRSAGAIPSTKGVL